MLNLFKYINHRILLLSLSVLITGISAGIFFGIFMSVSDRTHLADMLVNLLLSAGPDFIPSLFASLILLIFILLTGSSRYGFPVALFLLLLRAFSAGFCGCLLLNSVSQLGVFKFIISFMLPQLLLIFVYLTATAACITYALSKQRKASSFII